MTDQADTPPPDNLDRTIAVASPDDPNLPHIALAGGAYTILLGGKDTAGCYCLIDMRIPAGGGPPPHRHDFEEMFTVLEGEIELTFRGTKIVARTGETVNIPANAPHSFKNVSGAAARMLCMCAPAGQDEFFLAIGDRIESPSAPPPHLSAAEQAERRVKAQLLAARYRTEFLQPPK